MGEPLGEAQEPGESTAWPALRLVLDTNVVVAGLLWRGPPHRLMMLAADPAINPSRAVFLSSPVLLDELAHTLGYAKFSERIKLYGSTVQALVAQYAALVSLVSPAAVPRVVANDPDDDHVIAAAVTARADLIVTGDSKHLLSLGSHDASHGSIGIVTAAQALATLGVVSTSESKQRPS